MPTAIRIHGFGNPADVLVVEDVPPVTELGAEDVVIQMLAASVNPADINVIEGKYGKLPELPATIGHEGVGCVVRCGKNVRSLVAGDIVLPMSMGTWAEQMVISADSAIVLPTDIRIAQSSLLTINPATAYGMLTGFVELQPGDWIVQNAANSAVGRSVIQVAKILGLKTLNVVRRQELFDELSALGADLVVTENTDLRNEVENLCGGRRPRLALNAVGGTSALNIANALCDDGVHITFGAMGRQPVKIPNGLLIFRGLRFDGFWLPRWWAIKSHNELKYIYELLAEWVMEGRLHLPVHKEFLLSQPLEAVAEAQSEGRTGKVIFRMA